VRIISAMINASIAALAALMPLGGKFLAMAKDAFAEA